MATHTATISWSRGDQDFASGAYSRAHEVSFDAGITIPASSSPHVVRLPYSREDAIDPEEMLVASLSSCHMLWFLHVAKEAGFSKFDVPESVEGIGGGSFDLLLVRVQKRSHFGLPYVK